MKALDLSCVWQVARRWVAAARRWRAVRSPPLVGGTPLGCPRSLLLGLLLMVSCTEEPQAECDCAFSEAHCVDNAIAYQCAKTGKHCILSCEQICAARGQTYSGLCMHALDGRDNDVCFCEGEER